MTKPTLLLVDDNEPLLRLLKAVFDKSYAVFTAADGVEVLHLLSKGIKPNLIICDVQMQNIGGFELVAHLSTSMLYRDIPIILITGTQLPLDIPQGGNVVKVMYKPFDPVTLGAEVNAVMNESLKGNLVHNNTGAPAASFFSTSKS